MGYDLHITRAPNSAYAERYPIQMQEVTALVEREPDLTLDGPGAMGLDDFFVRVGAEDWLWYERGELTSKNPRPHLIRRMVEIGQVLDAWVVGDDGELYGWNGDVTTRQPTSEELPPPAYHLIGRASARGYSWEAPIAEQAWLDLVATQSDFVVRPWVTARLPSGVTSIPCPPVAYWTGHPSGEPVPFFFDRDHIEVARDPATLARLRELAPLLDARVFDDELKPA